MAAIWTELYGILALLYITLFPVMVNFQNMARPSDGKDYELLILDGISDSYLYSKRYSRCYRLFLFYLLISPIKTLLSCILTISSLYELTEEENGVTVPKLYWASVIGCYVFSLLWIMVRGCDMYNYYPYNINHDQLSYDKSLLPYLVFNAKSSILVSATADYANAMVSMYISGKDPSISITYKITLSMALTVAFLSYGLYDRYSFWRRSKQLNNIRLKSSTQQLYTDYKYAHNLLSNNTQTDENRANAKNIFCVISGIIFFIVMVIAWVAYLKCYEAYYESDDHSFDNCAIKDEDHIITWFIVISVTIPYCLLNGCSRFHCYRLNACLILAMMITMVTFGSKCVHQNGDKYNIYCGPAGYNGGIVMIVLGIFCGCCCLCTNGNMALEHAQNKKKQFEKVEDEEQLELA